MTVRRCTRRTKRTEPQTARPGMRLRVEDGQLSTPRPFSPYLTLVVCLPGSLFDRASLSYCMSLPFMSSVNSYAFHWHYTVLLLRPQSIP